MDAVEVGIAQRPGGRPLTAEIETVGVLGDEINLEPVMIALGLDLTRHRAADRHRAARPVPRLEIVGDVDHGEFVGAFEATFEEPVAGRGNVIGAAVRSNEEETGVAPGAALVDAGADTHAGVVVQTPDYGVLEGTVTSRFAAQIETVRIAHLQFHGKPVSVGAIVDHGGDRSPNLDRTGACVEVEIAEIVRNLLDEDFVTAMGYADGRNQRPRRR